MTSRAYDLNNKLNDRNRLGKGDILICSMQNTLSLPGFPRRQS